MATTIKINGMSCGHCVMAVKNALKEAGVNALEVEIGKAVVEGDVEAAKKAIEEEGYDVVGVE